jgi:hypothetical protein
MHAPDHVMEVVREWVDKAERDLTDSRNALNFESELRQALDDLGISGQIQIER